MGRQLIKDAQYISNLRQVCERVAIYWGWDVANKPKPEDVSSWPQKKVHAIRWYKMVYCLRNFKRFCALPQDHWVSEYYWSMKRDFVKARDAKKFDRSIRGGVDIVWQSLPEN